MKLCTVLMQKKLSNLVPYCYNLFVQVLSTNLCKIYLCSKCSSAKSEHGNLFRKVHRWSSASSCEGRRIARWDQSRTSYAFVPRRKDFCTPNGECLVR